MSEAEDGTMERIFENAIKILGEYDTISVSTIQRRFAIGYTRASEIVDRLEQEGHILRIAGTPKYITTRPEARTTP